MYNVYCINELYSLLTVRINGGDKHVVFMAYSVLLIAAGMTEN